MKAKQFLDEKNFMRLIVVGLGISMLSVITYEALSIFYISIESLKATISLAALAYISYVLKEAELKVGKVSIFFLQSVTQLILLLAITPLDVIIGSNLLAIWLVRTFYLHRNLVDSIGDIVVLIAGLAASSWALKESHSLLLGFWSFFLVQSLLVFLPKLTASIKGNPQPLVASGDSLLKSTNSDEAHISQFNNAFGSAKKRLKETREQCAFGHSD